MLTVDAIQALREQFIELIKKARTRRALNLPSAASPIEHVNQRIFSDLVSTWTVLPRDEKNCARLSLIRKQGSKPS